MRTLRDRLVSLQTKLTLATLAVLALVSAVLYVQVTNRERENILSRKAVAGTMVIDLFAESLSAALDFRDKEAVEAEVAKLRNNVEIVGVGVYGLPRREAWAEVRREGFSLEDATRAEQANRVLDDRIEMARPVLSRKGATIGRALLVFTLAPENAAFVATRRHILWYCVAMAVGTSLALSGIARWQILRPLENLNDVAVRIRRGDWAGRVVVRSTDELGKLGHAFNAMGEAISDRERKLAAAHGRIRGLFDNMRQGIVAFGPDGKVVGSASRQARELFGVAELEGHLLRDLLFPHASEDDVEACLLTMWSRAAFEGTPETWADLASLAPTEAVLTAPDGQQKLLELEFRPIVEEGTIQQIMLLATDVTSERDLQQAVRAQSAEHERQMAAMRRLVSSGTHVFVAFLEGARARVIRCGELFEEDLNRVSSSAIDETFRNIHTIKGEARSFELKETEAHCSDVEDRLEIMRNKARGDGYGYRNADDKDDLMLLLHLIQTSLDRAEGFLVDASPIGRSVLDQVTVQRKDIAELMSLVGDSDSGVGKVVARLASRPFGECVGAMLDMVPRWAQQLKKRAGMEVLGKEVMLSPRLARVVPGIFNHLVRNALAHGIESPEGRAERGKGPIGLITVSATESDAGPVLAVKDDGQGLLTAQIHEKQLERGPASLLPPEAAVFLPGFSTTKVIDKISGRGVGLDAVLAELSKVGYDVRVISREGVGAEFVLFPHASPLVGRMEGHFS